MSPLRYIALVHSEARGDSARIEAFARKIRSIDSFRFAYEDELLQVATSQDVTISLEAAGFVLGSLFHRDGPEPVSNLNPWASSRISVSCGQDLITHYWGSYIAFLPDMERRSVHIVRAPLGSLPCYLVELDGGLAVASDVGLLVACGLYRPTVDWNEVLRHLMVRDLYRPQTCLAGLRELQGGERLSLVGRKAVVEQIWSPWTFAARERQIDNPVAAARTLARVSQTCIAASASQQKAILLMLSGGLNSSVLAACLAGQNVPTHCLTFVTEDATGDERRYARQVSRALGLPLTEGWRDLARINVARSDARRLPRPSVRMFFRNRGVSRMKPQERSRQPQSSMGVGATMSSALCNPAGLRPTAC